MGKVKTGYYRLFAGGCDLKSNVKFNKLAEIFSQLADEQVEELKQAYPFLNQNDSRWILVRYNIEVKKMIAMGERIKISTYQSSYSKYVCIRDYIVQDESGTILMFAQCQWVMRNETNGKICAIPEEYATLCSKREEEGFPILIKIHEPGYRSDGEFDLHTRFYDYDFNGHVNNSVYFSYILNEQFPIDLHRYRIRNIDINYKSGMEYGKSYHLLTQEVQEEGGIALYQRICNDSDIAAVMITHWTEKSTI